MSANKVSVFKLRKFFSIDLMFPSDEQQNTFIAEIPSKKSTIFPKVMHTSEIQ